MHTELEFCILYIVNFYLRGSVAECIVEILSLFPFSIPEQFTFSALNIDKRTASNNFERMWKIINAAADVKTKEITEPITMRAAMSIGIGDVGVELSVEKYFNTKFKFIHLTNAYPRWIFGLIE